MSNTTPLTDEDSTRIKWLPMGMLLALGTALYRFRRRVLDHTTLVAVPDLVLLLASESPVGEMHNQQPSQQGEIFGLSHPPGRRECRQRTTSVARRVLENRRENSRGISRSYTSSSGFMRSDENVGVHRFVQATFLQNRCVRIDGCCIHPFFGLFRIVEEKRDLHVFPAFGAVPKNHGKRLNWGSLLSLLMSSSNTDFASCH